GNKQGTLDVYATHMQAGCTPSEHASRRRQCEQLGQFIARESHDVESVVLAGDLNMGPSLQSVHYADETDAKARVESYELLRERSGLRDVVVTEGGKEGDINRFLT